MTNDRGFIPHNRGPIYCKEIARNFNPTTLQATIENLKEDIVGLQLIVKKFEEQLDLVKSTPIQRTVIFRRKPGTPVSYKVSVEHWPVITQETRQKLVEMRLDESDILFKTTDHAQLTGGDQRQEAIDLAERLARMYGCKINSNIEILAWKKAGLLVGR
jgi:hypothetical protein